MFRFIQYSLLGLFLALGPVFWGPYVGKIIFHKFYLLCVLFVLFSGMLLRSRKIFLFIFACLAGLYCYSMQYYEDSAYSQFLNVYLDLMCAWFFLCIGEKISHRDLFLTIRISLFCCIGYCVLFWLYYLSGRITVFPLEYSHVLSNGNLNILPFYNTGWGFGRTQWNTCLSGFIPALFFFLSDAGGTIKKNLLLFFLGAFIIFATMLTSGGRGGIAAAFLCFLFCLFFAKKGKALFFFSAGVLVILLFVILRHNAEFYRLNGDSLSADRAAQWGITWQALKNLPLWGFGDYGNASIMERFDINYAFHDSFLRYLLGFGIPAFFEGIFIFYLIGRSVRNTMRQKNKLHVIALCGCVLAGFICSFTEPNPIFVAFYWPLWWFSAGCLYNVEKEKFSQHKLKGTSKIFRGKIADGLATRRIDADLRTLAKRGNV